MVSTVSSEAGTSSEFRSLTCSLDWWVTAGSVSLPLRAIQWDLITLQWVSLNGRTGVWQGHELNMRPLNTQTHSIFSHTGAGCWNNSVRQTRGKTIKYTCHNTTAGQDVCVYVYMGTKQRHDNTLITENSQKMICLCRMLYLTLHSQRSHWSDALETDTVEWSALTCSHQQCSFLEISSPVTIGFVRLCAVVMVAVEASKRQRKLPLQYFSSKEEIKVMQWPIYPLQGFYF